MALGARMKRWFLPVPPIGVDPEDWPGLLVVTATILGEAEGESPMGKLAVAYVIRNREKDRRWPDTLAEVCLQPRQFSCWNPDSPRVRVMSRPQGNVTESTWGTCFHAAISEAWSLAPDPTGGANHYLAPESLSRKPSWADDDKITARVGGHVFYRL